MADTDGGRERALQLGLFAVFVAIASLAFADLLGDFREGTTPTHALVEGAVATLGLFGVLWSARQFWRLRVAARTLAAEASVLTAELSRSRADAARFAADARDLIAGLSAAIDRQLEAWALSKAEKEIALLLLKGLSHREIAGLRAVSEATVRQQARALYKKAGLNGRADLAAFFLEDILAPGGPSRRSVEGVGRPSA